jgi:hypothetical protein
MRSLKLAVIAFAGVVLSLPAFAATADMTGSITTFTGGGTGLPTTAAPLPGSALGVSFASNGGSFTLPSAVWIANSTSPVGFTPNASPNSIYTIRTITNSSNNSGSFSGTAGTGPYTGIMGSGSNVTVELGLVPLPNVFGGLVLPVNVGSPGTVTAMALILTNAVTVTVQANGWTTGVITINDQTVSAPTATTATTGTATGTNNLSASGGTITLVSPFLVLIRGATTENRAGYAQLSLSFSNKIPEPGTLLLLGSGVAGLAFLGRRKRA